MVRRAYVRAARTKRAVERQKYKKLQKKYKFQCRKAKRKSWRFFLETTPNENKMAIVNKIIQQKNSNAVSTFIKEDGSTSTPGVETLRMLVDTHFPAAEEGIPQQPYSSLNAVTLHQVEQACQDWITVDTVRLALRAFKPGKAAGPDDLKPIVFRYLPDNILNFIVLLYRAAIILNYTPTQWRKTKIIFLPKPGKDSYRKPKSFRPISLSNYILKGLERLVVWEMDLHLKDHPIHPKQHGFTKGKGTEVAVSNSVDKVEFHLYRNEGCLGMFLDISSAFDSIHIDHIKDCLLAHGGLDDPVRWYHNYLGDRHLEIQLQDATVYYHTATGFPQGGVASAKFWLIAFDKAIRIINKYGIEGNGYADDCSALIGGSNTTQMVRTMQKMLDELTAWGRTCGLRFNPEKSVAVYFTRKKKLPSVQLKIDGKEIPYSYDVKYLGVTLDSKLHWTKHINDKITQTKRRMMQLPTVASAYWGPKPRLMKRAWTGLARPILDYNAFVWAHEIDNPTMVGKLRKLNRLALNTTCSVPRSSPTRGMEMATDTMPLHLHLVKAAVSTFCRIHTQVPLEWEGVYSNKNHSISHRKYWQLMCEEIGIDGQLLQSDGCDLIAPEKHYRVDMDSFQGDRRFQQLSQYNIYTDGSKTGSNVGAGYVIMKRNTVIAEESLRLPVTATIFQAEVYAIMAAARHLKLLNEQDVRFVKFFVDCQPALQALNAHNVRSRMVHQAMAALNSLNTANVYMVWTKAHVGTEGNEMADSLAKAGSLQEDIMTDIQAPKSKLKANIDECMREKWNRDWERYPHARQTKFFYPGQSKEKGVMTMKMNRLELARYIRIITGHNNLFYHRSNIDPDNNNSICRFCLDADETFIHFFTDCPALWSERRDTILRYIGDPREDWTPQQLVALSFTRKITEALEMDHGDRSNERQGICVQDGVEGTNTQGDRSNPDHGSSDEEDDPSTT